VENKYSIEQMKNRIVD